MTEQEIEEAYERRQDRLDEAYLAHAIDTSTYERMCAALSAWADERYAETTEAAGKPSTPRA